MIFAMDPTPLRKLIANIAYVRRCSKKEGLAETSLMLSRVLHAVREEIQNREDALRVEACTQTMETGTQALHVFCSRMFC